MSKFYSVCMFVVCIILLLATPVMAAGGEAGGAAPVLRFGVGARAFAMGGAYTAVADDATAVYWNPAGLAMMDAPTLSAMHSELFVGTTYDYLGYALPLKSGGFGLNYLNLSTPGIITSSGEESASNSVVYCGYGVNMNGWRFGLTGKFVQETLPTAQGSGWGLDVGFLKAFDDFQVGFTARDVVGSGIVWSTGLTENPPIDYRLGLSYRREKILLSMEYEVSDFASKHFGFEYSLNDYVKLRAGLYNEDLTAGVGLTKGNWAFDYAYCAGDLGNTHRLSFNVKFQ